ncbi:hypothetical protein ABZY68_04880 [Streptomyces sp. NPDC006482]|uniref:hypothetical protein n=1 Tax=Streptomyces sp. NPDC006482 TaxID=3154306 RepID=UPI0033B20852
MYGPPQAPQSPQVPQSPSGPASGGLIALRVLFVALALLSCGFLAWAPLLRLAVLTRTVRDWVVFGLTFVAATALFVYIGTSPDEEPSDLEAFLGVGTILVLGAGSVAYYLVGEIRHHDRRRAMPMPVPPPYRPLGYVYGPDGSAVTTTPSGAPAPYICAPPQPMPPAQPIHPAQPTPPAQPTHPAHQPPTAPRIDQVRAELDELSDLLRKDGREGEDRR